MTKPRDGRAAVNDPIDAIERDERDVLLEEMRSTLRLIASAVTSIEAHICATGSSGVANNTSELMDAKALCARLGVSRRWIQRHLIPTIRATPGGRAWFDFSDVEAQLAVTKRASPKPAPERARAHVERRETMSTGTREALSARDRLEAEAVERRLRATSLRKKRNP